MWHRLAIAAALAGAVFGVPDAGEARSSDRHRRFDSAPVVLTSPLATEPLRAGETVLLAWEALPELRRFAALEEWEAFLSLDDGGRYPVRLTPHLDLDRRSFPVTLPQFAAQRARLLLRFGDEAQELEYLVPGEFEIRPARQASRQPAGWARGFGEPARLDDPADPGVTIWVEGTREGHAARTVVAAQEGSEIGAVELSGWIGIRAAIPSPGPPQATAAAPAAHSFGGLLVPDSRVPPAPPRRAAIEPLRRACRQNE